MRRLNWLLTKTVEKVGLSGWLLFAMIIVVTVYALCVLIPTQQRLAELELQPKPKPVKQTFVTATPHQIPVLENMPETNALTASLQQFFNIVDPHGLVINEVSYNEQQRKGDPVVRYHINFAVEQDYPTIKSFVLSALEALPYLALDTVSFERESVKQGSVVANLRFTLYMVQP